MFAILNKNPHNFSKKYPHYSIPEDFLKKYNRRVQFDIARDDPDFIDYLKNHPDKDWTLVEIPNEVTDWDISLDYAGQEYIIAILNNELHYFYE